jgi:hypothetical protein
MEMHGILNMKALLVALVLLPFPALAEDVTVSVGGVSEVWTLAASDQQKFEAWVKFAYPCKPVPPATECTPLTLAESEALWAKATLQGTADNVTRFQNIVAAKAAVDATTPVGFDTRAGVKKR